MSMYDEEHGLDGPVCAKCKMVNCMSARGCAKRQTHNELTNLREKMVKLKVAMSKRELEVVDARRERDAARADLAKCRVVLNDVNDAANAVANEHLETMSEEKTKGQLLFEATRRADAPEVES